MLNHLKIKEWIFEGENSTLEFKVQVPNSQKIARTISAFANTRGGRLLIGVMDNGDIVGVVEMDKEKKQLEEAARFYCDPPVDLTFEIHEEYFLQVLVAIVQESEVKPHYTLGRSSVKQIYIRVKDRTMPASKLVGKTLAQETFSAPKRSLNSREKGIIDYADSRSEITLKDVMGKFNLSKRRARRILIDLTQEGFLRIHTTNKEDYYTPS